MNWTLYLAIAAVLAVAVIVLFVRRRQIAGAEDDVIHVQEAEAGMINQQQAIARKLEAVDRWGKVFTLLLVLYGLFLAGLYVYNQWMLTSTTVAK